jgi:hypothetical protein
MPRYTPRNMDELRTCPRAIQEPAIAQHAEFNRRPQTNHQPQDRSEAGPRQSSRGAIGFCRGWLITCVVLAPKLSQIPNDLLR